MALDGGGHRPLNGCIDGFAAAVCGREITGCGMAFRGPQLADIPETDLVSFVLAGADERGDKPALIDGPSGRVLTYGDLVEQVERFGASLRRSGFGPGDTLAVLMPNSIEYPVVLYGALVAGGRCTTLNPSYTHHEVRHQIVDSGASMIVVAANFLDTAEEATTGLDCSVVVVGDHLTHRSFTMFVENPVAESAPAAPLAHHEVAVLPYSSGTTGLPKGVMLTHRNLVANLIQMDHALRLEPGDILVAVLPFFHIYGLHVILSHWLWSGGTLVTMPRFELGQYLELNERHRATLAYVVPPIALALATAPSVADHDLSSLRGMFSGAAPLGEELASSCASRLGVTVAQGYGMTELSPVVTAGSLREPSVAGSVGTLMPGTEARLVDPVTGADSAEGERGELWFRGPQVMAGYLNNPSATAATIDDEGWLHTGDIAVRDEAGRFYIVDRVKELIKYKGFQVAPAELEDVLISHPDIADCGVVGRPDPGAGEIPVAFVVPAGEGFDPAAVMAYVAERVAPYKQLREISVIDAIPKSPSGKILRRPLRALL